MAEHTYARDMGVLVPQIEPFTESQQREVHDSMLEAIGYGRGRMDASQDHRLPWCGIDPLDFGASFARHVADGIEARRTGTGSSMRRDIRSAWDAFVVDGRVS